MVPKVSKDVMDQSNVLATVQEKGDEGGEGEGYEEKREEGEENVRGEGDGENNSMAEKDNKQKNENTVDSHNSDETDEMMSEKLDPEEKRRKLWRRIIGLGFFLTILKTILGGLSDLVIKKFTSIHPIVLLLFRSLMMLSLTFPLSVGLNNPPFPSNRTNRDRFMIVLRSVLGGLTAMATFYSLQHLPLGDQKMIVSSRPIFTIVFARLFLKEHFGKIEILCTLLTVSGVILVILPDFLTGRLSSESYDDEGEYLMAALVLLVSQIFAANIPVILRYLRKENLISLVISRELVFSIITFLVVMCSGLSFELPTWQDRLKILLLASFCILTSGLNILAFKLEEANKIVLVERSSAIVVAFVSQYLAFGTIPGLLTSVGVGLVTVSILIIGLKKIWSTQRRKKTELEDV